MNSIESGMSRGEISGEINIPTETKASDTELPKVIVDQDNKQNRISQEIINGMLPIEEIQNNIESPYAELGVKLKEDNHPDKWLVFVEEEVGQLGGDAAGIIDKIKEIAKAKKTKHEEELKQEIKITVDTLPKMGFNDVEIKNKLDEMKENSEEKNNISLNEFIKMLKEAQGNSMVAEKIIKILEGLMNEKNIDLSESEKKVSENLKGEHSVASWVGYFEKRFTRIKDYIDNPNLNSTSTVDLKGFKDILLPKDDETIQTNIHIITGLDTLTKMTENQ